MSSPPLFPQSPTPEQATPQPKNDVAIQSLTTVQIDIQPLIPENAFLHGRQSQRDNITELVDAAAKNLRETPPEDLFKMQLRPITLSQREAQPLYTSYLTDIPTNYNSPERKISGQSDAKRTNISAQKRKTPHQKKHRSVFRITTALFVWGTFFIAHTVHYSTVNKQQLPEFKRGSAFIFKYQVITSESES